MLNHLLIIIIILIFTISLSTLNENYTSLDTIYPDKFKKIVPDSCGECGGLCQYCNHGIDNPLNCNKSFSNYKHGYLNPQNVVINKIDLPNNYICINDKNISPLIDANYVYIYSKPFNKSLAFESYGNKSFVYVDKKIPTNNDCLTTDQYETQCKTFENNAISYNKHLPQKWRIDIKSLFNANICLITISSYSCNGLTYYLTANENGSVSVSLISGSDNQVWQIYKNTENDDNTIGDNAYLIKSHKYCTFLTSNNDGYMRNQSGTVSLTNIKNSVGRELMWNIDVCGKRIIKTNSNNSAKYRPLQSTTDFPFVNDNIGLKKVLPKDLNISDDVNKKWTGRSVWMKEFSDVWNSNYTYSMTKKENTLTKIDTNVENSYLYKIISNTEQIDLKLNINLDKDGKGTINIDVLNSKIEPIEVKGNIITYSGLTKQKTYDKIINNIETKTYNIQNNGVKILTGEDETNSIFIENIDNKSIKITITNKIDGSIKLSTIAKKI